MALSIRTKLFLTLLFASGFSLLAVQASMYWSFRDGLREMIEQRLQARLQDMAARLVEQYREDGDWSRLASDRRLWLGLVDQRWHRNRSDCQEERLRGSRSLWEDRASQTSIPDRRQSVPGRPAQRRRVSFDRRLMLFDAQGETLIGQGGPPKRALRVPLVLDGTSIGELVLLPGPALHEAAEQRFHQRQTTALPIIALAALSLSALLAWWLSRWLARPVLGFRDVARQLASGQFAVRAAVAGRDELAGLGQDLNALAATLAHNEQARRRWVADISHELRTPVSLLRAQIEALQDGLRPLDADTLASLHGDTMRLSHLIDDLYQLSLSDLGALSYRKRATNLAEVLAVEVDSFRALFEAAKLGLTFDNRLRMPTIIQADPQRLAQLIANLLRNSLQYTDPGGSLAISLSLGADGGLQMDFQDTTPGVPETERARLFERLYRVEPSRSRDAGGAGLGLAIAQKIVEAHQGHIEALAAPQGGLWIKVLLPRTS